MNGWRHFEAANKRGQQSLAAAASAAIDVARGASSTVFSPCRAVAGFTTRLLRLVSQSRGQCLGCRPPGRCSRRQHTAGVVGRQRSAPRAQRWVVDPTELKDSATHGNEFNGIPVMHRLVERLDIKQLRGVLEAVPLSASALCSVDNERTSTASVSITSLPRCCAREAE